MLLENARDALNKGIDSEMDALKTAMFWINHYIAQYPSIAGELDSQKRAEEVSFNTIGQIKVLEKALEIMKGEHKC